MSTLSSLEPGKFLLVAKGTLQFIDFKMGDYLGGPSLITGEDNGTPLQYSCLENPMDGGAW